MTSTRRLRRAALLALPAAALLVGGCAKTTSSSTLSGIRGDVTPERHDLAKSHEDVNNSLAIYSNLGNRMFWEDVGVLFMTNRPSRLTSLSVPY